MAYSSEESCSSHLPQSDAKGKTDREALPLANLAKCDAFCVKSTIVPFSFSSILNRQRTNALIADADDAIPLECGNEFLLSMFS